MRLGTALHGWPSLLQTAALAGVYGLSALLLLIALVIAALGIATTLTVLVLERSRQLNTLFAVGASFRQIRSMIFWEVRL